MNVLALYNVPTDDGSYSGGSWETTLPLANLTDDQPSIKARTTDAYNASTQFKCDLGRARPLRAFLLAYHNMSSDATVRIVVSNNSDGSSPILDTTQPAIRGTIVWGSLPFGEFPFGGVDTTTLESDFPSGLNFFYLADDVVTGRYVFVYVDDEDNDDGYVEIGEFMAGNPFIPAINMSYSPKLNWIDPSKTTRSKGGQLWSDNAPKYRRMDVTFGALTEDEAMTNAFDINRYVGLGGKIFIAYNADDDAGVRFRRAFYGALAELNPISTDNPTEAPYSWSLAVEERL